MMESIVLTEEHERLQERIRGLVAEHVTPRASEIDRKDVLPKDLLAKLQGEPFRLPALSVPVRFGGLGLDPLAACIVAEELAYGYAALIPFLEIAQLFTHALLLGGSEAQQSEILPRIAGGEVACYALTDGGPGSDPAALTTRAERAASGYKLYGRKRYITFADLGQIFVFFARAEGGITGFVADRKDGGIHLEEHVACSGLRGHRAYDLKLDGVPVRADRRLGKEGSGLKLALNVLNETRVSLACGYVGLARASLDAAMAFARERVSGGKPLVEYQAILFPLVELATRIDAARLLAYRAAAASAAGRPHRKETSMAKAYAAETLLAAVTTANQVMGGEGCRTNRPVERYVRDAYSWVSAQGTVEIQKLTAGRELLRERVS